MKILIVSDAWLPQTNGVVNTLSHTRAELEKLGHPVRLVTPEQFFTIPCPSYKEIRLAVGRVRRRIQTIREQFAPDSIHIATEGPLGLAARKDCLRAGKRFTTSFHTKFPEYVQARFGVPASWSYTWLRRFHNRAARVMVATRHVHEELRQRGFQHMAYWTRGVDLDLFRPREKAFLDLPRPLFLCVGRVAIEKNLEAFLSLDLPGSRMIVGDGPQLETLKQRYPDVHFPGAKHGAELARYFAAADVFVFPSKTDTFGLVLLEALASGVPVAAYPVTGPQDVITDSAAGVLDNNLQRAALRALELKPEHCRAYAQQYSWAAATQQFLNNLVTAD